ncbi:fibrinogen-like protein 1 isoform X1 [Nothoprocta perdicaria]|uniref:fibrinogen-like protein 1 isoform X1 n=1 Tax=Nothoprocta perdicaria TaxID=30464 RepID=UPI000E1B9C38|nr:fibrinogen-like protein 1 isoform X1 [Nothoprocta perdicaria]XP_025889399.1 fibrinogen-like protein 1 isoform X1 [Nothoprocta perdicaria]XP_025889400.1 fibrinogen-like protein 1 isoform X1 [Nothoprocta perdicaria]
MKILVLVDFILAAHLVDGTDSSDLQNCFQEHLQLQAQVRLLEHRVKQQQLRIIQLLEKKEIQYSDEGDENNVIDLGGKRQYSDCAEIYNDGHKQSGFYKMKPVQSPNEFLAFCDMSDGGGWTVFQRRSDGSQNFNRVWADYEEGFGNFASANGEFWLGNKKLHYLTSQGNYTLRIDLTDFEGERRYAQYTRFRVAGEERSYEMSCGEYSGTAGDSLTGGFHPEVKWWADHRGMKFSTRDRDNDNYEGNCAEEEKAGWWFNRCHSANLNGLYYRGPYAAGTDNGVVWYTWHGWWYSLKSVAMKVRPAGFEPNLV